MSETFQERLDAVNRRIEAACARFEDLGVAFQKRLSDGRMKNIAFIRDPDDYWVEIIPSTPYQP